MLLLVRLAPVVFSDKSQTLSLIFAKPTESHSVPNGLMISYSSGAPFSPPPPNHKYSYSLDDIYKLSDPLGLPWKASKTRPFASVFVYLGFTWDLDAKTVQIPPDKKLKYLRKLEPWFDSSKNFTLRDAQSLLGTLVHCTQTLPDGRSRLPALTRFVSSFSGKSTLSARYPGSSVLNDILWWARTTLYAILRSPDTAPSSTLDNSFLR